MDAQATVVCCQVFHFPQLASATAYTDSRHEGPSRGDSQQIDRRHERGQDIRRSPPRRGPPYSGRREAYNPSTERGWTGGGGRGLVDNRVRRKRQREGSDTRHAGGDTIDGSVQPVGGAAAAAAGSSQEGTSGTTQASSKAPRRRAAAASAASGRLFGALFKGQLQSAKQTLESKPVAAKLAAQAAARAAAEAAEAETRTSLAKAERSAREAQLSVSQAKKRVVEATVMASRWKAHYGTLAAGEYLATQAEPALFWKPAKPNAASLQGLLQRRKHSQDAMAVQQPLWDEFVAQEKRAVAGLLGAQGAPQPATTQRVVVTVPPIAVTPGDGAVSDDGEVSEAPAAAASAPATSPPADPTLLAQAAHHEEGEGGAASESSSAMRSAGVDSEASVGAAPAPARQLEAEVPRPAQGGEGGAPAPTVTHSPSHGAAHDDGDSSAAVAALLDDEDDE